jgi:CspA family cold shock protein
MEIHWTHVEDIEASERQAAEDRIRGLSNGHSDLIDVRVVASKTRHHRRGGCEVRIVCLARGKEIVARRMADNVGLALNEALDAFEREVRRLRDRRAGHRTEAAMPPDLGIVDRVHEDGFGFVLTDRGEQVYFHRNAVSGGLEFDQLEEGQRVALSIGEGEEGPQATAVIPAPPDAPVP